MHLRARWYAGKQLSFSQDIAAKVVATPTGATGQTVEALLCLVASLRPKIVLMEDVPQLLQGIFADDLAEFESNGPALATAFEASLRILSSLPFGGSLKVQRESQKSPASFVLGWGTSGAYAPR